MGKRGADELEIVHQADDPADERRDHSPQRNGAGAVELGHLLSHIVGVVDGQRGVFVILLDLGDIRRKVNLRRGF